MQDSNFDRRKSVRVEAESSISVAAPGTCSKVAARLVNLSQGGIRFVTLDSDIELGEVLDVRLASGESATDVTVRVVRAEMLPNGSVDVAAAFVDEPVADRAPEACEASRFVPVIARSIAWIPTLQGGAADRSDCSELEIGIRFQCVGVALEPSQLIRVRMEMRGRRGTVVGRVAWVLDRDRFHREIALTVKQGDAHIMKMLEADDEERKERARVPAPALG